LKFRAGFNLAVENPLIVKRVLLMHLLCSKECVNDIIMRQIPSLEIGKRSGITGLFTFTEFLNAFQDRNLERKFDGRYLVIQYSTIHYPNNFVLIEISMMKKRLRI